LLGHGSAFGASCRSGQSWCIALFSSSYDHAEKAYAAVPFQKGLAGTWRFLWFPVQLPVIPRNLWISVRKTVGLPCVTLAKLRLSRVCLKNRQFYQIIVSKGYF
jgi:hypothetical protein